MLLFRSDNLYCHGVLHLKQQGLDTYLIEKDNRVKPTKFIYYCIEIIFIIIHMPYILCQMLLYNWPIIHCIAILHNSVAEKGGKIRWG